MDLLYKRLGDFFLNKDDTPLTRAEAAVCMEWLQRVSSCTDSMFSTLEDAQRSCRRGRPRRNLPSEVLQRGDESVASHSKNLLTVPSSEINETCKIYNRGEIKERIRTLLSSPIRDIQMRPTGQSLPSSCMDDDQDLLLSGAKVSNSLDKNFNIKGDSSIKSLSMASTVPKIHDFENPHRLMNDSKMENVERDVKHFLESKSIVENSSNIIDSVKEQPQAMTRTARAILDILNSTTPQRKKLELPPAADIISTKNEASPIFSESSKLHKKSTLNDMAVDDGFNLNTNIRSPSNSKMETNLKLDTIKNLKDQRPHQNLDTEVEETYNFSFDLESIKESRQDEHDEDLDLAEFPFVV